MVGASAGFDGIGTFDLKSEHLEVFTKKGTYPIWLRDGRRLVYGDGPSLMLLDTTSGETQPIASFGTDAVAASSISLPRDESSIYFSLNLVEADAWLLEMK